MAPPLVLRWIRWAGAAATVLAICSFVAALLGVWSDPRWGQTAAVLLLAAVVSAVAWLIAVLRREKLNGERP